MRKIKLFCLPYAGGTAYSYLKWKEGLADFIELCPIELAGRGKRFNEPFYANIDDVVDDVYKQIKDDIGNTTYAIFGHSMGSIILYELYFKIMELNYNLPIHLFISGRKAPDIYNNNEITYNLPQDKFIEKILKYGGTPKGVLDNKELADLFIPLLRADFKIVETYKYIRKDRTLNANVTVMYGEEDGFTYGDIDSWTKHVSGKYRVHTFEGGHFFIYGDMYNVTKVINETLREELDNKLKINNS